MKPQLRIVMSTLAMQAVVLTCGGSCAPLTVSLDQAIDFERYPSVHVAVISGASGADTRYLVAQLLSTSGFQLVTADPEVATHAFLQVELSSHGVTSTDADGWINTSYEGEARFTLFDAETLEVIDSGSVEDSSAFALEIDDDLMDRVALHYHRPFRL